MSIQNRLFAFTHNDNLLIGSEVAKASRTKQIVRQLQREKRMVEDWKLDIFCRDPQIITSMEVSSIESGTALGSGWKYSISIVKRPASTSIRPYTLTIAWFRSREEAEAMIDTIQAYITLRYGV